jgi:hypothetical protein
MSVFGACYRLRFARNCALCFPARPQDVDVIGVLWASLAKLLVGNRCCWMTKHQAYDL